MGLSILVAAHKFVIASWTKLSLAADVALSLAAIAICFQISQFDEFVVYGKAFDKVQSWDSVRTIMNNIVYSVLIVISIISTWKIYSNLKRVLR